MYADSDNTEPVLYDNQAIDRVYEFKYLGFTIDTNITWKRHIDAVISKVKQRLYCLRRSRYYVSRDGRLMLLNALVMPYFTYGIELWFTANKTLRGTLELLLRHCLRIVVNDTGPVPTTSNIYLYISLNVLPLSALFQLKLGSDGVQGNEI